MSVSKDGRPQHASARLGAALLATLAAVAMTAAPAAAATGGPAASGHGRGLQRQLDELVAAGVPGAILLTRDGHRTRRYAGGLSDVAQQQPMRPEDRFRIASLTKTFTATVVLQLVAEGRLSLEDSVEQRLPGLVPGGDGITIRQLLNHTSGLFDHENDPRVLEPYLNGDFGHYWEPRTLVEIAVSHPPLFEPGARHSYSNTNYVVAGLIVEAVTGRPFADVLQRRLFGPLRLRDTEYPLTPEIVGSHAHGYLVLGLPPAIDVTGISPSISPMSGAIVSSAADVATFYGALLAGRLLPPALMRQMKTTLAVEQGDRPGMGYGLGLVSFPTPCGRAWGHNGAQPGYLVYAFSSASGRRQAVLMANLDAGSFPAAARRATSR